MLKELQLAKSRRVKGKKINVENPHILAPSNSLFQAYWNNAITWGEFEKRYGEEMKKSIAREEMRRIKKMAKREDVFLLSYPKDPPNHRFILMDLIKNI